MIDHLRNRLRWLADDCLERRRLSSNESARTCYWMAFQGAGQALALRHATAQELQAHLNAMEAAGKLGRWHDGHIEEYDALLAAPRPARLFNARQLADMDARPNATRCTTCFTGRRWRAGTQQPPCSC
ncbi:hypothetical protein [Sphingobium tyrosinilyticum]|uniref:Uncharacterized protein n=1 Tax=Sphingobium tyrosinilyticum TaxID=2715436 RepID=A0ABV9EY06_9SPHN